MHKIDRRTPAFAYHFGGKKSYLGLSLLSDVRSKVRSKVRSNERSNVRTNVRSNVRTYTSVHPNLRSNVRAYTSVQSNAHPNVHSNVSAYTSVRSTAMGFFLCLVDVRLLIVIFVLAPRFRCIDVTFYTSHKPEGAAVIARLRSIQSWSWLRRCSYS